MGDILEQGRQAAERDGPGLKGRKNAYECEVSGCGAFIVTIDRDTGVTPFMLRCGQCGEPAYSKFYRVQDWLQPTHEWYRPESIEGVDCRLFDHIEKGGLVLRPIAGKPDKWTRPDPVKQKDAPPALASVVLAERMREAAAVVRDRQKDDALEQLRKAPISRQVHRREKRKGRRA